MAKVKIGGKHQVVIPAKIFKALRLKPGDVLEVEEKDNQIVLSPTESIPREQAWFWTREWQRKMREAAEDIKQGKVHGPFTNAEALIKSLES